MYVLNVNVGGVPNLYLKDGEYGGSPMANKCIGKCVAELNLHALRRHTASKARADIDTAVMFCRAEGVAKAANALLAAKSVDEEKIAKAALAEATSKKIDVVEYYYENVNSACESKKVNGILMPDKDLIPNVE
jgi:hypothetical protein